MAKTAISECAGCYGTLGLASVPSRSPFWCRSLGLYITVVTNLDLYLHKWSSLTPSPAEQHSKEVPAASQCTLDTGHCSSHPQHRPSRPILPHNKPHTRTARSP